MDLLSSWICSLFLTTYNKLQCARPFATPSSWSWTGLVGLLLSVIVPHIGLTGLPCFTRWLYLRRQTTYVPFNLSLPFGWSGPSFAVPAS